jgi:putative transport protein
LPPTAATRLQFGDTLVIVGEPGAIKQVAAKLGDSLRRLNHPQIIPVFLGIALGVIVGSVPLSIPGMSGPVRLGLAGGPLLVAIALSRLGNFGPVVWYMPISANFMLRELGIVLFLACVGLNSGDTFVATLKGPGLLWMLYAALVTLVPLLVVAMIARAYFKLNYLTLCGLLAGSMTDPPALAFAGAMTGSDAPSVSYATVYPLVMLLRVLSAQAMVMLLA